MQIQTLTDLPPLSGVRVLVRAALNVPLQKSRVADPTRLVKALPTVTYLLARGARVVIIGHLSEKSASLRPVYEFLKNRLPIAFVSDIVGHEARAAVKNLKDGEVLMLENLRWSRGEEANDEHFARELASFADLFVADDFTVAHRAHAAVVTLPRLIPAFAGEQFMAELAGITPALSPRSPSVAIVGGAKFVTKEALIHTLLSKYDAVAIGGALANDFLKAKGYEVGHSLVSDASHVAPFLKNSKILVPEYVVVSNPAGEEEKVATTVTPLDTILDVGLASVTAWTPLIMKARNILWNGPLGNFENGYRAATEAIARVVAAAPGDSVVGGGDTLAAIQSLKLENQFTFVSTAGGAMLQFIADGTLPGIEALRRH